MFERAFDRGDPTRRDASIAGRRVQLLVSEQSLNVTNVRAALEQMGREAMAKRMQSDGLAKPRGFRGFLNSRLN